MIDQTEIRIGVSIGCAFGPIDGATVDDLILKADLALYEAKGAGRGVAKYFSSELQTEQDDRVRLETDLRGAIAAKQFHLVFQPLVNAKTQKLVGFEALIRWNHPQRGFVPPNVFIPVAEESGLMPVIGEWVIEEAIRAAASWPEPITVALNVSPKQIVCRRCPTSSARRWRATSCRPTGSSWRSPNDQRHLDGGSPHVAGGAALHLAANPTASAATVRNALVAAATPNVIGNPGTGSPNLLLHRLRHHAAAARRADVHQRHRRQHPGRRRRRELPDHGRRAGRQRLRGHPGRGRHPAHLPRRPGHRPDRPGRQQLPAEELLQGSDSADNVITTYSANLSTEPRTAPGGGASTDTAESTADVYSTDGLTKEWCTEGVEGYMTTEICAERGRGVNALSTPTP